MSTKPTPISSHAAWTGPAHKRPHVLSPQKIREARRTVELMLPAGHRDRVTLMAALGVCEAAYGEEEAGRAQGRFMRVLREDG